MAKAATPRVRAVDAAIRELRDAILTGRYPAGTDLPPERELAVSVGVSRLTLRAALERLQSEGLLNAVHGSGNRVRDYREHGGLELLGPLARLSLSSGALSPELLRQVLEMRLLIAVQALGLAAERATQEQLRGLREQIEVLGQHVDAPAEFMEADLELARRVIDAAHNLPLRLLYNTVTRAIRGQFGLEVLFMAADPNRSLGFYRHALALVEARDADGVRAVTQRLLAQQDARLLRRLQESLSPAEVSAEPIQEATS